MTESDEVDLLSEQNIDSVNLDLTQDEIDSLLDDSPPQDPPAQLDSSNGAESSLVDESNNTSGSIKKADGSHPNEENYIMDEPVNDSAEKEISSFSNGNDSNRDEATSGSMEIESRISNNEPLSDRQGNDTSGDCLGVSEEQNAQKEIADLLAEILPTDSAAEKEKTDGNIISHKPFLAHDLLLNGDEDNDNVADDDDVTFLNFSAKTGTPAKRGPSTEDDDILIADDGNPPKKQRREERDNDVVMEEVPAGTSAQLHPRFMRLQEQMVRVIIDRYRKENPEVLIATYMNNEVQKCQNGLRGLSTKINELNRLYKRKAEELCNFWQTEYNRVKSENERLTQLLSQNARIQKTPQPRQTARKPQFSSAMFPSSQNFQLQTPRATFTPKTGRRSDTSSDTNSQKRSEIAVSPFDCSNVEVLPDRIGVDIALVLEPRKCYTHNPFDGLPLRDYPQSMNRLLRRGIRNVQVLINTGYEDFVISKKIHGQIRYNLPPGVVVEKNSLVRLYYWAESIHNEWQLSNPAKLFPTGSTKFTIAFHRDQKLFQGDRVAVIAFISVNAGIRFVSGQTTFNMRKRN